jgi:hypothetical protein
MLWETKMMITNVINTVYVFNTKMLVCVPFFDDKSSHLLKPSHSEVPNDR